MKVSDRIELIGWLNNKLDEKFGEAGFALTLKDYKRMVSWQTREKGYRTHTIPKRSGGTRTIHVPSKRLKSVLTVLNEGLQEELTGKHALASCVIGFVRNRSIVDGAREHCRRRFVFNTDLKASFRVLNYTV